MKKLHLLIVCCLFFSNSFTKNTDNLYQFPLCKGVNRSPNEIFSKDKIEDLGYHSDRSWKRKGFEFYIGGGIYFGSKRTANYYNGAPANSINLHLLWENEHYRKEKIVPSLKEAYRAIDDNIVLREDYNYDSRYSIAMDVSLGARYRFHENWYLELSYSFRRVNCENFFYFDFPGGVPGNKDNPPYSNREYLMAKEDRHYIDFSVGYILQKHSIAKPFVSLGAQFNYVNIKSFTAIIEKKPYDLIFIAKNPNFDPGIQNMPNYRVWSGPGYGFSLTAGLKIAVHPSVSLDPVFQLSVASFGNSSNLPGFNNSLCFNYMAGVRIVMNDALFMSK